MSDTYEMPNQPNSAPAEQGSHGKRLRIAAVLTVGTLGVAGLAAVGDLLLVNNSPPDGPQVTDAEVAAQPTPAATESLAPETSPSPIVIPTALPTRPTERSQIVITKPKIYPTPSPSAYNTIPTPVQPHNTYIRDKDVPAGDKIVETAATKLRKEITDVLHADDLRHPSGRIYGATRSAPIFLKPSQGKPSFIPNAGKIPGEIVGSVTETTDFAHPGVTYVIKRHASNFGVDQGGKVGSGAESTATLRYDGPIENPTTLKSLTLTTETLCLPPRAGQAPAVLCHQSSTRVAFTPTQSGWKMHEEKQSVDPGFAMELTDADVMTLVSELISHPGTATMYAKETAPVK